MATLLGHDCEFVKFLTRRGEQCESHRLSVVVVVIAATAVLPHSPHTPPKHFSPRASWPAFAFTRIKHTRFAHKAAAAYASEKKNSTETIAHTVKTDATAATTASMSKKNKLNLTLPPGSVDPDQSGTE